MEQLSSYLRRIQFDKKLENSWIAKYLSNPRLVFLVILLVVGIGLSSFFSLPRSLNPDIKIPIVIVSTVLPGAGPSDIESLVTKPLEDSVQGLEKVKEVTSTSRDSVSVVSIEFLSGTDPDKAKDSAQSAVDGVILPEDSQDPRVQKLDFERQPVWTFAVTGKDTASLIQFSKDLKNKVEDIAAVDEVSVSGLEEEEIQILLQPESLITYRINPNAISGSIKAALGTYPGGKVQTQTSEFAFTIDPAILSVDDVRNLIINTNGSIVKLSDIATVSIQSKPNQLESFGASKNGSTLRSVNFDVFRVSGSNIENTVKEAENVVEEETNRYGNTFEVHSLSNIGEEIQDEFNELQKDFLITISLVFFILLLFLGIRQAIVAAISTPLTFFITFTVMNLTGISLNFIAFFSLLLSLGLLVDDTIVVISAMTSYYRTGRFTPLQTALLVWRDFLVPIFTTTITTVWAFIPLLLSSGIIGEFIRPIPVVVSTTLLASFFIAMFVTMPIIIFLFQQNIPYRVRVLFRILALVLPVLLLIYLLPKDNSIFLAQVLAISIFMFIFVRVRKTLFARLHDRYTRGQSKRDRSVFSYFSNGVINFQKIDSGYRRMVERILSTQQNRRKAVIMVVVFWLFTFLLVPLGFVKNEFFPSSDAPYLYVNLELPPGTNGSTTKIESLAILNQLKDTDGLDFATLSIGRGVDPSGGGFASSGENSSLFTLLLDDKEKRKDSQEIAQKLRDEFNTYPNGTLTVQEISGGPPAGSDLQIKLKGSGLGTLDTFANQLVAYLEKQTGVTNVSKSIKPGVSKISFSPNDEQLALYGIDRNILGFTVRTFVSGLEVDDLEIDKGNSDRTKIAIRTSSGSQNLESLHNLSVSSQQGSVPLSALGTFTLKQNPALITREGGKRTLSVSAAVSSGFNIQEINGELEKYADSLNLPSGYSWQTGGVNEENQNSVNSILQAMLLSFFLIIVTMVIQFGSFRRALIVMLVIPLATSGVFLIFALTNTPLSFPALIGVLALFGIVVKNSILIVDKIIANRELGMDLKTSIADASQSRLEAIALTTICTIAGLIPITLSDPFWRGLGGAIIAGLTFSGTIMLFFIPVVYYMWFQSEEKAVEKKIRKRSSR